MKLFSCAGREKQIRIIKNADRNILVMVFYDKDGLHYNAGRPYRAGRTCSGGEAGANRSDRTALYSYRILPEIAGRLACIGLEKRVEG